MSVGYLYQVLVIRSHQSAPSVLAADTDTNPPSVITANSPRETFKTSTSFTIATDEPVTETVTDTYSLELIEKNDDQFTYLVTLDNLQQGDNRYTISLSDPNGNTNQHQFSISRKDVPLCWDGRPRTVGSVIFPYAIDTVIDKFHKLDPGFYPVQLVNGGKNGIPVYQGGSAYVVTQVYEPLKKMINAIEGEGINVVISSGYRSFAAQARAHSYWSGIVGRNGAGYYAAQPGFSEHHLGTTIDLLTPENAYSIAEGYDRTGLGRWLQEHAHEYGFVMSYPKGKEAITGYNYEPWHWRYLGTEHALAIRELGITPVEYLYALNETPCN